jgi:hypothetical protein
VSVAAAARYDTAFAALVMSAVALEMARPRRGCAPLACLAIAGLVRPEAWLLAGTYWAWLAPALSMSARLRAAALALLAPAVWLTMDVLATGDPLHSLHATDAASANLYLRYTPWQNLEAAGRDLVWYVGLLPLLLLAPAMLWLLRDRPRAAMPPLGALALTLGVFLLLLSQGMPSSGRYLLLPVCMIAVLAGMAIDGGGRRTAARVMVGVVLGVMLCVQVASRSDVFARVRSGAAIAQQRNDTARALVRAPGVRDALLHCPVVSLPTGGMRHWFAFHSGRAPAEFVSDALGRTRPDLYIAPATPDVAQSVLTRPRFDFDASFRVPPGLRAGPRNADWVLYVSPTSTCTSAW